MIVWRLPGELRVTRQTDHMQQVGDIGLAWFEASEPARRPAETLVAARWHDEGWREYERRPAVDRRSRLPYQFTEMPQKEWLHWYSRGADEAQRLNPYAGLLVSMHASGLRLGRYGVDGDDVPDRARLDPDVRAFVEREEQRQLELRLAAEASEDEVWHDYGLLQAWDRLSIFICGGRTSGTLGPVALEPGGTPRPISLRRLAPDVVVADPYPFPGREQEFPVRTRRLAQEGFESDEELWACLAAAPFQTVVYQVVAAPLV